MAPIAPPLYPRLYRELMGLKYEVIIRTFPHCLVADTLGCRLQFNVLSIAQWRS